MSEALEMKPAAELSPQQMQEILLSVRARVQKGEDVSDEEVRYAVGLIPLLRADASTRTKAPKAGKAEAKPMGLGDF